RGRLGADDAAAARLSGIGRRSGDGLVFACALRRHVTGRVERDDDRRDHEGEAAREHVGRDAAVIDRLLDEVAADAARRSARAGADDVGRRRTDAEERLSEDDELAAEEGTADDALGRRSDLVRLGRPRYSE